jgi:transcriptional regulator with XRE-family HTH domain
MAILKVNVDAFRHLMAQYGWSERELSEHMGLAYSYVNRVLSGKRQPGSKFVAGALSVGLTMEQAFFVVPSIPQDRTEP